jgi:malate dehydrogenase (oxaloacetate-decarboxylating)(NADP+)
MTVALMKGMLTLRKNNFALPSVPIGLLLPLTFPIEINNVGTANISYKLMMELAGTEAIGPILLGMKKPVHILQLGSSVREIINMVAIAVMDAQFSQAENK